MITYNRENYVDKAIESIIGQTFKNFEFIIVDNGSTDKSGIIAKEFAKRDSRIKVVNIKKSNIGTGRNTGLDNAKGEYITFIDDDDVAKPDMLEFLYKLALDNNAEISICGSMKEVNGEILFNYVFDEYLVMNAAQAVVEMLKRKKYSVGMPTKLFRKDLFDKIRFNELSKYDDIAIGYKLVASSNLVVAYGKPKYLILRHANNNSKFTTNDLYITPNQLEEYFKVFRERTIYLSNKLPEIADFVQYTEWSYMISMCNKITRNRLVQCSEQLKYVKKTLAQNFDKLYKSEFIEDFEKELMNMYIRGDEYLEKTRDFKYENYSKNQLAYVVNNCMDETNTFPRGRK